MKIRCGLVFSLVVLLLGTFLGIKIYLDYSVDYKERRMDSIKSQIKYYYKKCINESKCNNEITLDTLYTEGYIKEDYINPYTGETIDKSIILKYIDDSIIIEGLDN